MPSEQSKPLPSREELRARCGQRLEGKALYQAMDEQGYTLGPSYQWIGSLAREGSDILGEMTVPTLPDEWKDYPFFPGLIDSCFQVLAGWSLEDGLQRKDSLLIPFSISRFSFFRRPEGRMWVHARLEGDARNSSEESLSGDLRIHDEQGLVAEVLGFRVRTASREAVRRATYARRDEALYEVAWQPEPVPRLASVLVADGRPWLLLMDARGVGDRLAGLLEARGAPVVRVRPGSAFRELEAGGFELDARRAEDFTRLLDEVAGPRGCAGVVYLWGLDAEVSGDASAETVQGASLEASGGALHVVQALVRSPAPLWLVTRGAQAVRESRPPLALAQSPLWGFGRVVDLEHAELRCTRVDLDPEDVEESVRLLHAELGRDASAPEREVAFRGGVRLYPALRRASSPRGVSPSLRADGTYLITGGLGGLGLEVARWMVEQGARHLVLVGRRAPSETAAGVVRELERAGASVTVASADVSREEEVAGLLQRLDGGAPPLRGVVHAAGVLADRALVQQDMERFERVMAPKVAGAWNLHRLTEGRSLDFFILFSSASATLGSPGQGNYAAANAFLDVLAHERRARGQVAQSLDWGPWAETGMLGGEDGQAARARERRGIRSLPTRRALELMGEAMAGARPRVALLSIQWPVYLETLGAQGRSSFYSALAPARRVEGPRAAEARQAPSRYPMADRLQAALPHERSEVLTESLKEEIARILRLESPREVDWSQGFVELGMDSLMAIELRNALQKGLGGKIPATVALDHPTLDFLVKHLLEGVLKLDGEEAAPKSEAPARAAVPEPVSGESLEKELDALSDEELARLVAEDLAKE